MKLYSKILLSALILVLSACNDGSSSSIGVTIDSSAKSSSQQSQVNQSAEQQTFCESNQEFALVSSLPASGSVLVDRELSSIRLKFNAEIDNQSISAEDYLLSSQSSDIDSRQAQTELNSEISVVGDEVIIKSIERIGPNQRVNLEISAGLQANCINQIKTLKDKLVVIFQTESDTSPEITFIGFAAGSAKSASMGDRQSQIAVAVKDDNQFVRFSSAAIMAQYPNEDSFRDISSENTAQPVSTESPELVEGFIAAIDDIPDTDGELVIRVNPTNIFDNENQQAVLANDQMSETTLILNKPSVLVNINDERSLLALENKLKNNGQKQPEFRFKLDRPLFSQSSSSEMTSCNVSDNQIFGLLDVDGGNLDDLISVNYAAVDHSDGSISCDTRVVIVSITTNLGPTVSDQFYQLTVNNETWLDEYSAATIVDGFIADTPETSVDQFSIAFAVEAENQAVPTLLSITANEFSDTEETNLLIESSDNIQTNTSFTLGFSETVSLSETTSELTLTLVENSAEEMLCENSTSGHQYKFEKSVSTQLVSQYKLQPTKSSDLKHATTYRICSLSGTLEDSGDLVHSLDLQGIDLQNKKVLLTTGSAAPKISISPENGSDEQERLVEVQIEIDHYNGLDTECNDEKIKIFKLENGAQSDDPIRGDITAKRELDGPLICTFTPSSMIVEDGRGQFDSDSQYQVVVTSGAFSNKTGPASEELTSVFKTRNEQGLFIDGSYLSISISENWDVIISSSFEELSEVTITGDVFNDVCSLINNSEICSEQTFDDLVIDVISRIPLTTLIDAQRIGFSPSSYEIVGVDGLVIGRLDSTKGEITLVDPTVRLISINDEKYIIEIKDISFGNKISVRSVSAFPMTFRQGVLSLVGTLEKVTSDQIGLSGVSIDLNPVIEIDSLTINLNEETTASIEQLIRVAADIIDTPSALVAGIEIDQFTFSNSLVLDVDANQQQAINLQDNDDRVDLNSELNNLLQIVNETLDSTADTLSTDIIAQILINLAEVIGGNQMDFADELKDAISVLTATCSPNSGNQESCIAGLNNLLGLLTGVDSIEVPSTPRALYDLLHSTVCQLDAVTSSSSLVDFCQSIDPGRILLSEEPNQMAPRYDGRGTVWQWTRSINSSGTQSLGGTLSLVSRGRDITLDIIEDITFDYYFSDACSVKSARAAIKFTDGRVVQYGTDNFGRTQEGTYSFKQQLAEGDMIVLPGGDSGVEPSSTIERIRLIIDNNNAATDSTCFRMEILNPTVTVVESDKRYVAYPRFIEDLNAPISLFSESPARFTAGRSEMGERTWTWTGDSTGATLGLTPLPGIFINERNIDDIRFGYAFSEECSARHPRVQLVWMDGSITNIGNNGKEATGSFSSRAAKEAGELQDPNSKDNNRTLSRLRLILDAGNATDDACSKMIMFDPVIDLLGTLAASQAYPSFNLGHQIEGVLTSSPERKGLFNEAPNRMVEFSPDQWRWTNESTGGTLGLSPIPGVVIFENDINDIRFDYLYAAECTGLQPRIEIVWTDSTVTVYGNFNKPNQGTVSYRELINKGEVSGDQKVIDQAPRVISRIRLVMDSTAPKSCELMQLTDPTVVINPLNTKAEAYPNFDMVRYLSNLQDRAPNGAFFEAPNRFKRVDSMQQTSGTTQWHWVSAGKGATLGLQPATGVSLTLAELQEIEFDYQFGDGCTGRHPRVEIRLTDGSETLYGFTNQESTGSYKFSEWRDKGVSKKPAAFGSDQIQNQPISLIRLVLDNEQPASTCQFIKLIDPTIYIVENQGTSQAYPAMGWTN